MIGDLQPSGRMPAPDPDLRLVQAFVNTNDLEDGEDELATPIRASAWLAAHGVGSGGRAVDPDALARAIAVREGIRALAKANNREPVDAPAVEAMNRTFAELPLHARADASGWQLRAGATGVDRFLGDVLAAIVAAMADGRWSRLKACRSDECRWLFYDRSRNRSSTWCAMAGCGARAKARAYRARRTGAG